MDIDIVQERLRSSIGFHQQVLHPADEYRNMGNDLTFCSIVFSPAPPATSLLLAIEAYSHPCPNLLFLCSSETHPKGAR